MQTDDCGLTLSTDSRAAAQSWSRMVPRFLAHAADTPDYLASTLEADPHFAMGHAVKGLFLLLLGRRELVAPASDALAAARKGRAESERERLYIAALADWLADRPSVAAGRMEVILMDHPDDSLAAKIAQSIYFVLGDAPAMRGSIETVLAACTPDHPSRGYLIGCRAFALEETGAFREAEARGREALALAPDDAWGLHAVAHVYDVTARARDGLGWLAGRDGAWEHCNNFRYHIWWHKALLHLDLGETDAALALYDDAVRRDRTDDYRDIANAASLLARLELESVDIGDRWDELAVLAAARTDDGCLIFADLHYLLALIGGDRDDAAERLVARITRDATFRRDEVGRRMAEPGVIAARGLEAFGAGNYARAFAAFSAARRSMHRAGGSHAQRDIFERLAIDSAIRAGFWTSAQDLLAARAELRGGFEDGYSARRRSIINRRAWQIAG